MEKESRLSFTQFIITRRAIEVHFDGFLIRKCTLRRQVVVGCDIGNRRVRIQMLTVTECGILPSKVSTRVMVGLRIDTGLAKRQKKRRLLLIIRVSLPYFYALECFQHPHNVIVIFRDEFFCGYFYHFFISFKNPEETFIFILLIAVDCFNKTVI